ncbi:MAG: serine/threonine protein kinase [Acidobacteria bacterium]|nr:serine/threonine protein kinase [Acidobacteriota bacterium]
MADRGQSWIGRTVAQYDILEKLGGGGMGVVYKARDLRLGRLAALKFLPAHLDSQNDRRRFLNEARAASSLDHPNICTVYEIGETGEGEGGIFIAMACYEGETLKQKVQRGTLKIEEAIDYTIQIAAGLASAHAQGIIHRDIKPANLMITRDGQVKILDFGIAKLASETRLTHSGAVIGTTAYMSPEQILGEPVDHRTDIWTLGVVLYEMLAGRLPFEREDERAFAYAILHMEPRPIGRLRPDVPPELERILGKALQKNPADRYQNVNEIPVDLRALLRSGSRPTLTTGTTIVAMPQPSAPARRLPRLTWKRLATAAALTVIVIAGLLGFAAARQTGVSRAESPRRSRRSPTREAPSIGRDSLQTARRSSSVRRGTAIHSAFSRPAWGVPCRAGSSCRRPTSLRCRARASWPSPSITKSRFLSATRGSAPSRERPCSAAALASSRKKASRRRTGHPTARGSLSCAGRSSSGWNIPSVRCFIWSPATSAACASRRMERGLPSSSTRTFGIGAARWP